MYSYLAGISQYTKIKDIKSDTAITNTEASQGCILAPLMFTIYGKNCRNKYPNCSLINYADDNTIIGKVGNDNSHESVVQIDDFVTCYHNNNLNL